MICTLALRLVSTSDLHTLSLYASKKLVLCILCSMSCTIPCILSDEVTLVIDTVGTQIYIHIHAALLHSTHNILVHKKTNGKHF